MLTNHEMTHVALWCQVVLAGVAPVSVVAAVADENQYHKPMQQTFPPRARPPLAPLPVHDFPSRTVDAIHEETRRSEERMMAMWALHDQERAAEAAVTEARQEALASVATAGPAHQKPWMRDFD